MKSTFSLAVAIAFTVMFCMPNLTAKDDPAGRQGMIDKAMFYLGHVGQSEDGSFSSKTGPGVTGLVVAGLLSEISILHVFIHLTDLMAATNYQGFTSQ